jgi:transposase
VVLTGGEVSDVKGYGPVMAEPGPEPRVLLGDKGYDADAILEDLEARSVAAIIPPRRNRKIQPVIDGHRYALRNLIERCFSKLKHSRRLATRYDKTADSYLGFVLIASARLWVRHFVSRSKGTGITAPREMGTLFDVRTWQEAQRLEISACGARTKAPSARYLPSPRRDRKDQARLCTRPVIQSSVQAHAKSRQHTN